MIVDEFADLEAGHGLLRECSQFGTGLPSASLPWRSGRDHKLLMGRGANAVPARRLVRDGGASQVTIDDDAEVVVTYRLDDELDRRLLHRFVDIIAQLQRARGPR